MFIFKCIHWERWLMHWNSYLATHCVCSFHKPLNFPLRFLHFYYSTTTTTKTIFTLWELQRKLSSYAENIKQGSSDWPDSSTGAVQKSLQVGTSLLSLRWCWQMSCLFNAPYPPPAQVPFPPSTPLCVYITYCFLTDVLFTITEWNGSALSHPIMRRESSGETQAFSEQTVR